MMLVPGDEVLAALVALLRAEVAGSQAALTRAAVKLAQARERIAELEARLRQTPRDSSRPPVQRGAGQAAAAAVAAEKERPQAGRAGRA
jgi:hypothetical protein